MQKSAKAHKKAHQNTTIKVCLDGVSCLHRALLPVIPAPYTSCPKWYIKLLKPTKNGRNKSNKIVLFFLWGRIEIIWKLQSCCITSLAVISKRVIGGCVNIDWINAEVCLLRFLQHCKMVWNLLISFLFTTMREHFINMQIGNNASYKINRFICESNHS